jgi:hypothetical protein
MTCRYLNIEEKHRQGPGAIASIADFTVTDGDPVEAEIVIRSPNMSLYCFDDEAKEAIFVELSETVDLSKAPFVYSMQYEQAQRLIAMSYAEFRQLAHTLPPVEHLIMIYISGRSGSTLISHLFNELDHVLSLSEPDVGTQFAYMRAAGSMNDADLRDLVDCTVRMLFKPTVGKALPFKTATVYALKLRSEAVKVMDLYQSAFPEAKNLYSYRDAIGFVSSFYRVLYNPDYADNLPRAEFADSFGDFMREDFTRVEQYLDPAAEHFTYIELLTAWWVVAVEWYLTQYDRGVPALAVSYADLNGKREATLKAIFEYCGLPVDQIPKALSAYEHDSQAGTFLAREKPTEGNSFRFSEAQLGEIKRLLARHPIIKTSDFIAPGILRL